MRFNHQNTKKGPSRPKKLRMRELDEDPNMTRLRRDPTPYKCSQCGATGHNTKRCTFPPLVELEEVNEEANGAIKGVAEGVAQGADVGVQTGQLNVVEGGTEGATKGGNEGATSGVQTGQVNVVEGGTKGATEGGTKGEGDGVQTSPIQHQKNDITQIKCTN